MSNWVPQEEPVFNWNTIINWFTEPQVEPVGHTSEPIFEPLPEPDFQPESEPVEEVPIIPSSPIEIQPPEQTDLFAEIVLHLFQDLILAGVSRSTIDKTFKHINDLFITTSSLIDQILNNDTIRSTVNCHFDALIEIVQTQSSEHKRLKIQKSNPKYIEPIPICFGSSLCSVRRFHRTVFVNKPMILYQVPIEKTIQKLFESRLFEMKFFINDHVCQNGVYRNICCGSVSQSNPLNGQPFIKIQLYNDTVNLAHPLKDCALEYKLSAVYFRVLNLPLEVQSLEENIHLIGLFNENDVKKHPEGFNSILKHIVDMIAQIEINGVRVEIENRENQVLHGTIASLAGDNLAVHQLIGMCESFMATYFCCHCYITKEESCTKENLSNIVPRTVDDFYSGFDSTVENSPNYFKNTRGIVRKSELSRLRYFSIPTTLGVDPFHDLDEGFGLDYLMSSINFLINNDYLPSEEATINQIKSFDYGTLDIQYNIKTLKHLSGIQIRNLILRFNFIFGHLKDQNNDIIFIGMSKLSLVMQIVYSSIILEEHIQKLDECIKFLLKTYKEVFLKPLKPKAHFIQHYPEVIKKFGPLSALDTTAFERKHRFFTRIMEKHSSFKNVLKTCAVNHQIWWASKWDEEKNNFHTLTLIGKKLIQLHDEYDQVPNDLELNSPVISLL
uniref:CSON007801 protein n=1 Tax=Culicoides sonorensis TaxID=179676 RepID=A0A336N055_CULSO